MKKNKNKYMWSKSAVLFKQLKPLRIIKINLPNLKKGQVLVKIKYSGVCGSQIIEQKGGRPYTKKYLPHMLGHEASGIVIKVGPNVKKVKSNDKVILSWISGKGCNSGGIKLKYRNTKVNGGPLTTFNSYSIVSENKVFKKPTFLSMKNAALYGCAIPTGAGMILNQLKRRSKNELIFLFGLGGVGLASYLALKSLGYKKITIVEKKITTYKAKIIKKLKLNFIQNNQKNFVKKFNDLKMDKKTVFIDTSGDISVLQFCINQSKPKDTILFASHPMDQKKIFIKPLDFINGKKIIGSRGGNCKQDEDIMKISKFFKKNKINYNLFHSNKIYNLEKINKAFKDLINGNIIRPIIKLN